MFDIFMKSVIFLMIIQAVKLSETDPAVSSKCVLPRLSPLEALEFRVHPQNRTIELGSSIENYEIVHIACKGGQMLEGQSSLICKNGEWSDAFPTCGNYCDRTLLDRLALRAICDYRDKISQCSEKIATGTYIQLHCAYGFRHDSKTSLFLRCLSDGTFDKTPKPCEPDCGRIASHAVSLSKEGFQINASVAPWHVSIFSEIASHHQYMCGGSIVSPTVIISAAHCFWDETNQMPSNWTHLQVLAGSNSNNYSVEQTKHLQLIQVKEVHLPEKFRGRELEYKEDIAFLVLEKPLKYSETIAPVCFPKDLQNEASTHYMQSNKVGFVSLFGQSGQLERIQVLTLAYHDCREEHSLADDKFCVYANDGNVVWSGNSGAGFVIAKTDPLTEALHYHLWGVLSHSIDSKHEVNLSKQKVAFGNIFSASSDFKTKLLKAISEGERLI